MSKSVRKKDDWGGTLIENNKDDWGGTLVADDEKKNSFGKGLDNGITKQSNQSGQPTSKSPLQSVGSDYSFDPLKNVVQQEQPLQPKPVAVIPQVQKSNYTYDKSPFNVDELGQPAIKDNTGQVLSINAKTIPITPYGNSKSYIKDLQVRIDTGKLTSQDETFLEKTRKGNNSFNATDDEELAGMANKYSTDGIPLANLDGKLEAVKLLKNKILQQQANADAQISGATGGVMTYNRNAGKPKGERAGEFKRLTEIEKKLSFLKSNSDAYPTFVEAAVSTDESGNIWDKFVSRVFSLNPATAGVAQTAVSLEVANNKKKLTPEFSLGLNSLKYIEPAQFERTIRSLNNGEPISETLVANITAQGLEAKESLAKDAYINKDIDKPQYEQTVKDINKSRYENIVDNKETLRAFLSNGIANLADDINSVNNSSDSKIFGHKWNYSDDEIEVFGKSYAQANGIDPNDARVKESIQYLKDNEGAMIMQNSIAKSGWARDFAKGLATPIRGIAATVEDIGKTTGQIYAEGQSQGNVNVSEQKLNRVKNSWEGAVSDVMEGAGQLVTQAGIAALTSGVIGLTGKAILGRAGVAALEGDIALADMAASDIIGKTLLGSKDALATYLTAAGQSYDGHLKQALTYTSDDTTAKNVARGMAGLEGITETILSPLTIARNIGKNLFGGGSVTKGLVGIISDAAIIDKNAAVKNFLKATLKGGLETAKVTATEIGEEELVQLADYGANMILSPESKSFQNRDLLEEVQSIAYQTGLSMAIPALVSGLGAFNVNNFAKGTLLIAAQNRQALIDGMDKDLFNGSLSQNEYNEKAAIINTAATANETLPLKASGSKLNSQEKADYVFSRVSEGILKKKADESQDEAEKTIITEKIKQEQNFRAGLLKTENGVYTASNQPTETATTEPINTNTNATNTESGNQKTLVQKVKEKNVPNLVNDNFSEEENLKFLQEQSISAPNSFKNQIGNDEELATDLIATNSTEAINKEIAFQEQQLKAPDLTDNDITDIDNHIQLLEKGLAKKELVVSNPSAELKNEKEAERKEWDSVFNSPLNKVGNSVDVLLQKEIDKPDGFGSFIEKRDARETKEVADKYLNPEAISDLELKKDFSDALRGNPTTWYADGLKLREAVKESANRGITFENLLAEVVKVYTNDGIESKTAKEIIIRYLEPIFKNSNPTNKAIAELPTGLKNEVVEPSTVKGEEVKPTMSEAEQHINSLNDEEDYTAYVSNINEIPEAFRNRASKVSGEIKTRKSFLGIPYGKETSINSYRYTFTGKEAKQQFKLTQQSENKPTVKSEDAPLVNQAEIDRIESERKAELIKFPSGEMTFKNINPDGENTEVNDKQKATIERVIEGNIKAGETPAQIVGTLNTAGYTVLYGNETTTLMNYLKDRIEGVNTMPFFQFNNKLRDRITAKYDAELAALKSENKPIQNKEVGVSSNSADAPLVKENDGGNSVGGDYYIKDEKEFKKVDNAKPVKLDIEGDFFAVKNDNGGYTIHEAKSGVAIDANSLHKTIKDAVNNANEKISKNSKTIPLDRVIDGEIKRDGLSPRYSQNPKENTAVTDLLNEVNSGKINADDAAIKLDESGVEVLNEVYDQFREAEANFKKGKNGLQVGDTVTVKGKNGNPDFKGNFRGITKEGKYVVVGESGYQNVYEKSDVSEQSIKEQPKAEQPKPDAPLVGKEIGVSSKSNEAEIKALEEQRDAEIKKVSKPEIKLNLVSATELVNSKDPVGNKAKHDAIKLQLKNLKSLIECLN